MFKKIALTFSILLFVNSSIADETGTGRCFASLCGFNAAMPELSAPAAEAIGEGDDETGTGAIAECNWLEELFGLCSSGK